MCRFFNVLLISYACTGLFWCTRFSGWFCRERSTLSSPLLHGTPAPFRPHVCKLDHSFVLYTWSLMFVSSTPMIVRSTHDVYKIARPLMFVNFATAVHMTASHITCLCCRVHSYICSLLWCVCYSLQPCLCSKPGSTWTSCDGWKNKASRSESRPQKLIECASGLLYRICSLFYMWMCKVFFATPHLIFQYPHQQSHLM